MWWHVQIYMCDGIQIYVWWRTDIYVMTCLTWCTCLVSTYTVLQSPDTRDLYQHIRMYMWWHIWIYMWWWQIWIYMWWHTDVYVIMCTTWYTCLVSTYIVSHVTGYTWLIPTCTDVYVYTNIYVMTYTDMYVMAYRYICDDVCHVIHVTCVNIYSDARHWIQVTCIRIYMLILTEAHWYVCDDVSRDTRDLHQHIRIYICIYGYICDEIYGCICNGVRIYMWWCVPRDARALYQHI